MKPKISPTLDVEVRVRASKGQSSDAIAAWLKSEHGVSISGRALRMRLKSARKEQVAVTKAAVREKLAVTVVSDIDRLGRIRQQVAAKAKKISEDGEMTREWTALKKLEADILDRRIHYSGADENDTAFATPGVHLFLPSEQDGGGDEEQG